MRDRGKSSFACQEASFRKEWGKRNRESLANQFAAELLLPVKMFQPLCENEDITFRAVTKLAERFQTGLTATAIRLVELGSFPAVLVYSNSKGRIWFLKNEIVPEELWPRLQSGHDSDAYKLLYNETSEQNFPIEVYADSWIDHPESHKYVLSEHSKEITGIWRYPYCGGRTRIKSPILWVMSKSSYKASRSVYQFEPLQLKRPNFPVPSDV